MVIKKLLVTKFSNVIDIFTFILMVTFLIKHIVWKYE